MSSFCPSNFPNSRNFDFSAVLVLPLGRCMLENLQLCASLWGSSLCYCFILQRFCRNCFCCFQVTKLSYNMVTVLKKHNPPVRKELMIKHFLVLLEENVARYRFPGATQHSVTQVCSDGFSCKIQAFI